MEWTGARYADTPTVQVETFVAAAPERVWQFVSDIALMPQLSTELQRVEWCEGADAPKVGARFIGHNFHQARGEWQSTSTITECTEPTVFTWAVGDTAEHPMATWRFTLQPCGEGTTLRQWVQMGPGRSGLSEAIDRMPDKEEKIVFFRLREYETALTATVTGIKALAEAT